MHDALLTLSMLRLYGETQAGAHVKQMGYCNHTIATRLSVFFTHSLPAHPIIGENYFGG